MENTKEIAIAISTLLSFLGLAYLGFWKFKQLRVDRFRQNIFLLRDKLFDFAANGNISFEHPAYQTLRNMMNGYIRFSHQLSLSYYCLAVIVSYFTNREYLSLRFSSKWKEVTTDLDVETRKTMDEFSFKASTELFHYLFLSSFLKKALLVFSVVGAFLLILFLKRKLGLSDDKAGENFDEFAFKYSERHSKPIKTSIDTFNAGALAYGES